MNIRQIFSSIALLTSLSTVTIRTQGQGTPQRQDAVVKEKMLHVLHHYYDVKDALVNGDPVAASQQASALASSIDSLDNNALPQDTRASLHKDALQIAASHDLARQRSSFAALSQNMFLLVKSTGTDGQPVYYAYCPMKKTYWLSSESTIRNPYFGRVMISCGEVREEIK